MMKILIGLLTIVLAGCTGQTPKPLTDAEKATIKNDVKKEFNGMVEACNKVDIETALKYWLDSPDFIMIGPDGAIMNYAQFKKANEDTFNNATSVRFTGLKEDIKVLENGYALYIWQYSAEMILKSGEKIAYDTLGMTVLFQKIDGTWKIIFGQESGSLPVVTKLSE